MKPRELAEPLPDEERNRRAMKALVKALGPEEAMCFMRLRARSTVDYTANRHKWLKGLTIDDVVAKAKQLRRRRKAS